MPLRSIATAAAFVLGVLAPFTARATATAHIVQGPLRTTLIDLDTRDGIAPSLSVQLIPTIPERSDIMHWRGVNFHGETALGGSGFLDRSYDDVGQSGAVKISNAGSIGSMLLDARASTSFALGMNGRVEATATSSWIQFLLSPHTEVVLASSAQASGSVTDVGLREYARAQSELNVKLEFADGRVSYWSNGLSSEASTSDPSLPSSFDGQQDFDITFRNDSDATASGYLFADAFVWTSSAALPVPEPSMAWMLGPGLLVLGWRGHGRGKRPVEIPAP